MDYQEYGSDHNNFMMFIHGGGVGGWMWDKQVKYFSNFHCIVPELIDDLDDDMHFSIEECATKLLKIIEEKAQGKHVTVIGFSLGAQIIVKMLSLNAQLIDNAIINSALVIPSPITNKLMGPFITLSFPLIKNKSFAKLQAKTLYINQDYFHQYYQDSLKMKVETLTNILRENMSFAIPENFSQASCEILVTVGEKEKWIMRKSARLLVNRNPNCKGVVLSNVGHGVSLANPTFFNHFVENWMKEGRLPEGKIIH